MRGQDAELVVPEVYYIGVLEFLFFGVFKHIFIYTLNLSKPSFLKPGLSQSEPRRINTPKVALRFPYL